MAAAATTPSMLDADVMREVLECPICLELYGPERLRPKLLQCGHTVCRPCLEKLLAGTINGVRCPFCSRVSRMSSVSQLADNLTVLKLLDAAGGVEGAAGGAGAPSALACASCRARLPRRYCRDCALVLCELCGAEGPQHAGHALQPIRAAAEQRRRELGGRLAALRDAVERIRGRRASAEAAAGALRLRCRAVQQDYAAAELRLQEELGRGRRAFAAATAQLEKQNGRALEEHTYLLSLAEARAVSRCDYLAARLSQGDAALLGDREDPEEAAEEEREVLGGRSGVPDTLTLQEPVLVRTQRAGALEVGRLCPSERVFSTAEEEEEEEEGEGEGGSRASPPAPSSLGLAAGDVDMPGEEAVCPSPGSFKSRSLDEGAGPPPSPGRAGAGAGPPLCQLVKRMGCRGTLPGTFQLPVGVCVAPQGEVLVADRGNARVQVFNRQGFQREIRRGATGIDSLVLSFLGAEPPSLVPLGVAVTPQGVVGVTDHHDNSLKLYTLEGRCLACHKQPLVKPWGVAATPQGQLVVADVEGGVVWRLAVDREAGVLSCSRLCSAVRPKFVTCDAAGTVYFTQGLAVAPEGRPGEPQLEGGFSIGSVGADGRVGRQLSHFFSPDEDFRCVAGMCVDARGDLLVTDSGRREVLRFPREGGHSVLVDEGLLCPVGVAVTQRGQMLVLDCWDHCVKVYTYTHKRRSSAC